LIESLRAAGATLIQALQTRLELFSNEVEEQGIRLARMGLMWGIAAFCAALAVMLATVFLVVLFWDTHRLAVLGVLAAAFAVASACAFAAARSLGAQRPRPFAATLGELDRDRQAMRGNPEPAPRSPRRDRR
jgi:uncharacterized membrane protein YqjE